MADHGTGADHADDPARNGIEIAGNNAQKRRAEVLKRCSLSANFNPDRLPWYFHYEYVVSLMEAGDAERALDAFVTGANVREEPKRSKRMYGMWYIDYLPYYQIALAHSELGDWQAARAAIQASRAWGEFSPDQPGWEDFVELDEKISRNLSLADS